MLKPEQHLVLSVNRIEERSILRKEEFVFGVSSLNEVDHVQASVVVSLFIVGLKKRTLVDCLTEQEESKGVDDKVEEVTEVVF
jgi:hypothetical protein